MPITQNGSTVEDSDTGVSTITTSYTQGAGTDRLLLVVVGTDDIDTHDSVTFDGNALTKAVDALRSGDRRSTIWYLVNPPVVTGDVVVTVQTTVPGLGVIINSWDGVDQATPVNATGTNDGNSTTVSVTVASAIGELCIDGWNHDDHDSVPVFGAGQTELGDIAVGTVFRVASSRKDGAAPNVTLEATMDFNDWVSAAVSLNPAAVVAAAQNHQMIV